MNQGLLAVDELAARCGVVRTLVLRLVHIGVIDTVAGEDELFDPAVTVRLRRMIRLREDLGVNFTGAAMILDLVDRIEMLETRLRHYEPR